MKARDVEDGADFLDAVAFGAEEVGAGVGEGELGGGEAFGAEFCFEPLDGDAVEVFGGAWEGRVHGREEGA